MMMNESHLKCNESCKFSYYKKTSIREAGKVKDIFVIRHIRCINTLSSEWCLLLHRITKMTPLKT